MAKEKCAKESQRHGDSGKKASIAHFDGGARNVARAIVGELFHAFVRAPVLAFFRRQNGRAFFPPLPIAALLPRSWRGAGLPLAGWDGFLLVGRFWKVIGQRVRRARAMRPVAEWRSALAKRQGAAPDRRAARPVAERR